MNSLWFRIKYSLIEFSEEETLMSQGPFQFPMDLKDKTVVVAQRGDQFYTANLIEEELQTEYNIEKSKEIIKQEEKYDLLLFTSSMDFTEAFVNDPISNPLKIMTQTFSDQLLQKTENQRIIPIVRDSFITRVYLVKKSRKHKLLKLFYWLKWIEPDVSIWYRYWILGRVGKLVSIT